MNIPASTIQPFEPHGLPKLDFLKDLDTTTLEIILKIMDALDAFIAKNADGFFVGHDLLPNNTVRALGEHLCTWLEKTAMDAGADIVHAKARAIFTISKEIDELGIPKEFLSPSINTTSKLIGFMYLVDFTVNDESVNHLLDYKFGPRT